MERPDVAGLKAPTNPPTNAILKMRMFSSISLVSEVSARLGGGPRFVMFLSQCVGNPRAPVLSKRRVTHVRYHCRAEQKYDECQHNQVPPIPGHAVLPFFRV
jgi:hypothetical protein